MKELVDQKTFSSEKELWLRGDGEASQEKVYLRHSLKGCRCLSQSTPGCLGLCPQGCSLQQEWLQALPLLMEQEPRVSLVSRLLTSFSLGVEGAGAIGRGVWVASPGPSKSRVSVLLFYTYGCN